MGSQSTMVATWIASQPTVPDLSCGFQFHFSSGQRSKVLRVLCISWSNSGSSDCLMVITASLAKFEIAAPEYEANKRRTVKNIFHFPRIPHADKYCPHLVAQIE